MRHKRHMCRVVPVPRITLTATAEVAVVAVVAPVGQPPINFGYFSILVVSKKHGVPASTRQIKGGWVTGATGATGATLTF